MQHILADYTASISELKKNPSALISNAHGAPIAILNHNIPTAYLIPAKVYEKIMETFDDLDLKNIVSHRLNDLDQAVEVDVETL
jgi:antitoxin StbD